MDTESLKSLLPLLAWGALFFLMMRYGCGAHVMGGHGHSGRRGGTSDAEMRDPVCGMPIKADASSAAAVHDGKTYYFCSRSCRDKFEIDPQHYLSGAAAQRHDGATGAV